jgi:hypothetical protein
VQYALDCILRINSPSILPLQVKSCSKLPMRSTALPGTKINRKTGSLLVTAALVALTACTRAPVTQNSPVIIPAVDSGARTTMVRPALSDEFAPWFDEARTLVQQELNIDLTHVYAQVVDSDSIREHAKDSLMRALSHDLNNSRFAEMLVSNILNAQSDSVLAIYSPAQRSILIHRDNLNEYFNSVTDRTTRKAALQALMLHELIHAADDAKHNVFDQSGVSYQEVFSKSTILEGHAQWQTRRLCELASCGHAFGLLNDYMFNLNNVQDPALKYIQKRNFKNLEFVYREGERFVDHLMQKPQGNALLLQAIKQPPRDSLQIIDPESFPNKNREARNRLLADTIKNSVKPWSKAERGLLTRNILAAAAFTTNPETRDPIIEFYTERVVAAAKHEYYDKSNDIPLPVAITVMQTDNDTTARDTAALIFESTASTYRNLDGDLVELSHWSSDFHNATVTDRKLGSVDIKMNTASGHMNNRMVNSEYPFEVVTASSGNFIVHIDGKYEGRTSLMQYAGRLLLELRRQALLNQGT